MDRLADRTTSTEPKANGQRSGHDWLIVTTPPDVSGNQASIADLDQAFRDLGFEVLPWRGIGYAGSIALRKDGLDIWDIHPANVLLTEPGLPVPFDVMITPSP